MYLYQEKVFRTPESSGQLGQTYRLLPHIGFAFFHIFSNLLAKNVSPESS